MWRLVLMLCLIGCGADNETILVKEPITEPPPEPLPRGPIARPPPASNGGGLSDGPVIPTEPTPEPPPPEPEPEPPEPEPEPEPPPKPQLPGNLYGKKDFWRNDSGRGWPWCHRIPDELWKDEVDSYWGFIPAALDWCEDNGVYKVAGGCSCRKKA